MAQTLTDTSAIYALIDRDDSNHRKATAILRAAVRQGVTPLITNFIVAESHALLLSRLDARIARDWLTKQIWPVEPVTPADEKKPRSSFNAIRTKSFPIPTPQVSP